MRTCARLSAALPLLAFPSILISSIVMVRVMVVAASLLVFMGEATPSFLSIASK